MANLTKLEAVNFILDGVGETPATALDAGGTSIEGQAERYLDKWTASILAEGFHSNTQTKGVEGVTLNVPTTTLTVSGGAGTFIAGETITGDVTLSTGIFHQIDTLMYVSDVTGAFTAADALTGSDSGATRDVDAVAAVTEAEIVLADAVLDVDSFGRDAWKDVTLSAGKLYDLTNNTSLFSEAVFAKLIFEITFADLAILLQTYIYTSAAVDFEADQVASPQRGAVLRSKALSAKVAAVEAEDGRSNGNILATGTGRRMQGLATEPEAVR